MMFFERIKSLFGAGKIEEKVIAEECGHLTPVRRRITAFGETRELKLRDENKNPLYCLRCLEKMVIRCAWCGRAIFPWDPITLCTPKEDFELPSYAVVYSEDPVQLVGCLRMDCAPTAALRAGFWVPPGQVFRLRSPLEMAFQSGVSFVVKDAGDIAEAIRLQGSMVEAEK